MRWASRFFHLWALNGPYQDQTWSTGPVRYHAPAEMGRAERFVFDAVVADLQRDPPRVLFVLRPPENTLPVRQFDYVTYFSQDPRFVRAMQRYRLVDSVGRYQVYERAASAARP